MKGKGCNIAAGVFDILLSACFLALGLFTQFTGSIFAGLTLSLTGDMSTMQLGSTITSGAYAPSSTATFVSTIVIIATISFFIGFAVYLSFGIVTLKKAGSVGKEYYKARSHMLAFSIVETLFLAPLIYFSVIAMSFLTIIMLILVFGAVIFHWIGFGLNNDNPEQLIESSVFVKKEANRPLNYADELIKLNELKEKNILSEEEFLRFKQDLINRN